MASNWLPPHNNLHIKQRHSPRPLKLLQQRRGPLPSLGLILDTTGLDQRLEDRRASTLHKPPTGNVLEMWLVARIVSFATHLQEPPAIGLFFHFGRGRGTQPDLREHCGHRIDDLPHDGRFRICGGFERADIAFVPLEVAAGFLSVISMVHITAVKDGGGERTY